jgi:hypothetical protein
MNNLTRWILPISMVGIGIAILTGVIMPDLPGVTGLRLMVGLVCILLGIHRFVAARMVRPDSDRNRRYGGQSQRPWERKP